MILDRAADFFDFDGWTFLNCAYHGPMPRVAVSALELAVELRQNPARIHADLHFRFPDAYRAAVGALIDADAATVSVVDSATAGTMVLVNGLDWQTGDEVVIPRQEFPSNRLPWQHLAPRGVVVRQVDLGTGPDREARLIAAITPRTRVLAASWVSYIDGRCLDLAVLSAACRDRGVILAVDVSQGLGGLPFSQKETPCDVLIGVGYKWLLGPYGLAFVRVAPGLAERLTVGNVNWFATTGSEDFNRLADLPWRPRQGGRKFDGNETASFFNVAAGTAALRYVAGLGPAAIHAHCQALHAHLITSLPSGYAALAVDAARRSNILCITGPDEAETARAFRHLKSQRIAVSSREGAIRIAPHVYNTIADIDRLLTALDAGASATTEPPGTASRSDDDLAARLKTLLDVN
jgi:selenocysteine lyase/cysteine desulfurase